MCLLIYKPEGKSLPEDHARSGFQYNSDGAGFAYANGKNSGLRKGYFDCDEFVEAVTQPYLTDLPCVIHMRMKTHGSLTRANCHPFKVAGGWYMGHNGIIPKMNQRGDESDTVAFIRDIINPVMRRDRGAIFDKGVQQGIKKIIAGSKLVFLHKTGAHVIIGEELGTWDEGIWYSNSSYEDMWYHGYKGYSYYGSGHYKLHPVDDFDDDELERAARHYSAENYEQDHLSASEKGWSFGDPKFSFASTPGRKKPSSYYREPARMLYRVCSYCGGGIEPEDVSFPGDEPGTVLCWICGQL